MDNLYQPFYKGKKVYLREVRRQDVGEHYYQWMNDPEIVRYTESRFFPTSVEQLTNYVEKLDGNRDSVFLAVITCENHQHIGNVKLGGINWIHRYADVGIIIGDKHCWGKGYATEALQLVCEYARGRLQLHKVWAGIYAENHGSIKAFTRAGFVQEGAQRQHYYCEGRYVDGLLFGRLLEEMK